MKTENTQNIKIEIRPCLHETNKYQVKANLIIDGIKLRFIYYCDEFERTYESITLYYKKEYVAKIVCDSYESIENFITLYDTP